MLRLEFGQQRSNHMPQLNLVGVIWDYAGVFVSNQIRTAEALVALGICRALGEFGAGKCSGLDSLQTKLD